MPGSSTGAVCNSSNASNKTASIPPIISAQIAASSPDFDDYDPSYNLNRFLFDQNYPPGYKQALSPEEAKQRNLSAFRDLDAKFAPSENFNHC
ncbi:hypothetical protein GGI35DRAFT_482325 [Trichoderma velutinum]